MPSTGRPARGMRHTAWSSPRSRSQARSETWRGCRAGPPGRRRRGHVATAAKVTSRSGSRPRASTSVKLLIRGNRIDRDVERGGRSRPGGQPGRARPRSPARGPVATAARHRRSAGQLGELVEPRAEQAKVATELVGHEPRDQPLVGGLQQRDSAEQAANKPPRSMSPTTTSDAGMPGQAHVHVVAGAQVDLGGAAGALGDHEVVPRGQVVERLVRRPREMRAPVDEVARRDLTRRLPHHDDVAAPVTARLEQHRVHRGLGLCRRRPAPGSTGPGRSRLPSAQTIELFDMFCDLNGATFMLRRANARHSPVVTMLLPASEVVPATRSAPVITEP